MFDRDLRWLRGNYAQNCVPYLDLIGSVDILDLQAGNRGNRRR
jgi:hypothetical protein